MRLTKPKTNDSPSSTSSTPLRSPREETAEVPIRASFEDLKRPEARQLLRQQLTGTFPETTRKTSLDSARGSMSFKDRFARRGSNLEVGNNISAQSSTSTIDSVQAKRLSMVPEKDNKALDVEQAISLLQELKKTASPDDLVALHRALLPTKERESIVSPRTSTLEEQTPSTSPLTRRRSVLPPGLATRGGVAEDILRRPSEPAPKFKPAKTGSWFDHARSVSINSLAALDLADDPAKSMETHAVAPSEITYSHTGAYKHGTLRVTNGTASPEPGINAALIRDHVAHAEQPKLEKGYFTASQGRPSLDVTRGRASLDIIRTRSSAESLSIRERILTSDKAQQQRTQRAHRISSISNTGSSESLVSTPLGLQTRISQQSINRESSVSPMSTEMSTPRFQQRWSHRASQISQEYVSDCEITPGPYEDKNALLNFASRLSTVYDSDPEDTVATGGTREAALSKLMGAGQAVRPVVNSGSARTSDEQAASGSIDDGKRPIAPYKIDSGYESDTSFRRDRSQSRVHPMSSGPALDPANLQQAAASDDDDTRSLYTFEEILMSPSLLSDGKSNPHGSTPKKQTSTLLNLRNLRKTSMPAAGTETAIGSTDSIATIASTQSSPADPQTAQHLSKQQSKKLQKPIPKAVKEARRAEIRKQRELQGSSESDLTPAVPAEVSSAHANRLSGSRNSTLINLVPKAENPLTSHEPEPVELSGDSSFAAPSPVVSDNRRSSSRTRSKSRGRVRSNSGRKDSTQEGTESKRSWSGSRKRNQSGSRSRSQTPKRSSFGKEVKVASVEVPSKNDGSPESPGEDVIPAFTDFGSVARTLGSSAYDISTNQFKRSTTPVRGAVQHELQSPYMISTGLVKTQYMTGMNAAAASELARKKSRDVVANSTASIHDLPRMATPKRPAVAMGRPGIATSPSSRSVEDRFPDWQSKAHRASNSPPRPQIQHRPHSMYAESIPPLPELPADVEVKASKADVMVAKKLKESARSTPATSARNSAEAPESRKAESMKKAMQARQSQEQKMLVDDKVMELLHPAERAAAKAGVAVNVQVRELAGSGSERSSDAEDAGRAQIVQSPSSDTQHAGWPGWEQQAMLWRQRRESAGATLGRPIDMEEETFAPADSPPLSRKQSKEPSHSPAIVVSRYITPLTSTNAARASAADRPTDTAARHASAYRDLVGEDNKENRPAKPDVPRSGSALTTTTTTSTFVTVQTIDPRPAKQDVPRFDSAFSTKSYQSYQSTVAPSIDRSRSPGGRVRTASGKFMPYSPSQAAQAESSRALSLAKLSGTAKSSTTSLPEPGITQHTNKSSDSLLDRYSGGLGYGWERNGGFSESAGTRHSGSSLAKRKSIVMSESFGLDLSDVPVFLANQR